MALLMGGRSSEREISLKTGHGIAAALRSLGHDVTAVDAADGVVLPAGDEEAGARPLAQVQRLPLRAQVGVVDAPAVREADVVYNALHGAFGEDGRIQALLELAGKRYTGSGVLASALAMNKAMSKRVFLHEGIPTPKWRLIAPARGETLRDEDAAGLGGYPLVVKPNEEGSTVGLSIVEGPGGLTDAVALAARYWPEVLAEEYVPGRELTVAVLGEEALPVVEIRPKSGIYDYENKYTPGRTDYFCPADLPAPLARRVLELGGHAARALGCAGVCRVDFRLSPQQEPYCLEVNTIPGMTPTSLVPMAARAVGMTYEDVVARALQLAMTGAGPAAGVRT